MPDIDKMSLKELRMMLKDKRKATVPVSKMGKGALMKELITNSFPAQIMDKFEEPPPIFVKKTANQILEKSHLDKEFVPLEGYKYGAEELSRPGAKQFTRITGKKKEAVEKKTQGEYHIGQQTIQQPLPPKKGRGKAILKQTDMPTGATQSDVPVTKKQTSKKTMLAELDHPVGASMSDVAEAMVVKNYRGRPPTNTGHKVGTGEVITHAPPHLVISQPRHLPNVTELQKPMKYGGGLIVPKKEEPSGVVAKEVNKIETKSKRGGWDKMTAEQKAERIAKMRAGKGKDK